MSVLLPNMYDPFMIREALFIYFIDIYIIFFFGGGGKKCRGLIRFGWVYAWIGVVSLTSIVRKPFLQFFSL